MGFSLRKRIRSPRAPLPESRVRESASVQLNSVDKREKGNRAQVMQKANQSALNNGLASNPAASNRLSSRRSAERRGDYHVPV